MFAVLGILVLESRLGFSLPGEAKAGEAISSIYTLLNASWARTDGAAAIPGHVKWSRSWRQYMQSLSEWESI